MQKFEALQQLCLKDQSIQTRSRIENTQYAKLCWKLKILGKVLSFLFLWSFERILDVNFIQNVIPNLVNLNVINKGLQSFTKNKKLENKNNKLEKLAWLNESVESVTKLLVMYINGEISKIQDLGQNIKEMKMMIYECISFELKTKKKKSYDMIKIELKKAQVDYIQNQRVKLDIFFDECAMMPRQDLQVKITNKKKEYVHQYEVFARDKIQFKVSKVLIYKYCKRIEENFMQKFYSSFIYKQVGPAKRYYQNIVCQTIFDYMNYGHFKNGIANRCINENLRIMIHNPIWTNQYEANLVQNLISLLSSFGQVITVKNYDNPIDQLNKTCKDKLFQRKVVSSWWEENIDETTFIIVVTQLYQILTGFVYKNGKLQYQDYNPAKRQIIIKLMRLLNKKHYGYQNIDILYQCEIISHDIEMKIYNQLSTLITDSQNNQNQYSIIIEGKENYSFLVSINNKQNKAQQFMNKQYLLMNLFVCSSNQNQPDQEKQKRKKLKGLLIPELDILQKKYNLKMAKFYFEVLSKEDKNSNIITLCISGYLSGKENKQEQWKDLIESNSGTLIGLHWKTQDLKDLIDSIIHSLAAPSLGSLNSSYQKANQEAITVGQYLGLLIAVFNLFGGRQLNLICHSLGSIIVQSCINKLNDLFTQYKTQFINKVIIMGGVADIRDLQSIKFKGVYGKIYNFKSKRDQVLKNILSKERLNVIPCGLNDVESEYNQIKTYDFSEIVHGHNEYWQHLKSVIMYSDLCSDNNYLLENEESS